MKEIDNFSMEFKRAVKRDKVMRLLIIPLLSLKIRFIKFVDWYLAAYKPTKIIRTRKVLHFKLNITE